MPFHPGSAVCVLDVMAEGHVALERVAEMAVRGVLFVAVHWARVPVWHTQPGISDVRSCLGSGSLGLLKLDAFLSAGAGGSKLERWSRRQQGALDPDIEPCVCRAECL